MCGAAQVNPSLLVYQLTCSVCKEQFSGRNAWLKHLTQDNHQRLARLECLEKWDSEFRKCSMLIFTSTKLTSETAEEIVNYFSSRFNDTVVLVTDFVWWEDRPQLGVLQFESREKLKDVLKGNGSSSNGSSIIAIGSRLRVQMRAGFKLMELEWQAILPSQEERSSAITTPNKRNQLSDDPPETNQNFPLSEQITEPDKDVQENIQPSKKRKLDEFFDNSPNFLPSDQPPPPSMNSASHPLQLEYWAIRKAMFIPDNQYNQAMEVVSSLKTVLSKLIPNLKFNLFRNWYLKLKYPDEQLDLLLYVQSPQEKSTDDLCAKLQKFLPNQSNLTHLSVTVETPKENEKDDRSDGIVHLNYLPTNLKLSLITPKVPGSLMEFQVCRMLEYLCQFDPRCHALITLACYWFSINSIDLTGTGEGSPHEPENPLELPPHYTVQWLVIFFMAQGKYIPSPRQVQKDSVPEDVALLTDEISGGFKIGFTWNPNNIQDWKNSKKEVDLRDKCKKDNCISVDENSKEFVLSLLQLFYKFLYFCQHFLGNRKSWILNTAFGMIMDVDNLNKTDLTGKTGRLRQGTGFWHRKGLNVEDIIEVRNAVQREISVKGKCEIYMTHPFLLNQKMLLADEIKIKFKMFNGGVEKLGRFLKQITGLGVQTAKLGKKKGFIFRDVLKFKE